MRIDFRDMARGVEWLIWIVELGRHAMRGTFAVTAVKLVRVV